MKITVITDKRGKIVGTAGQPNGKEEAGSGGPLAGPDQTAREIELPDALKKTESLDELYKALEQHLRTTKKS